MRLFGSPHRYVQGPDVLDDLGRLLLPYGERPLMIIDQFLVERLRARLERAARNAGLDPILMPFGGEITYAAIDRLAAEASNVAVSAVVGIGGGKALDAAKGVSVHLGKPMITVPTIASNDSPTSAAIAVYDDHHVMIAVDRMPRSPDLVLVDTRLIAAAPVHFLRAGIGDAIAKKFEARGCAAGTGNTPFGTRPLITAGVIANACYVTLRSHAAAALGAVGEGRLTDDVEATVEAVILMSGLGFENGGLSIAHSLTRGLVQARGARTAIHGFQVAYGTLVQLAVEDRPPAEIMDMMGFLRGIDLPTCLGELGMRDATSEEIAELARLTLTAPHLANIGRPVEQVDIERAVIQIEQLAASGRADRCPA
ncbi:glycerol dehydrogenase [Acidisoma cellulosilytica]|uniref:Glycerol dehydrogenase n=1 Tax=Acidisoma cellulosilyticum TaxID=2802395 RepID=A0A963Z4X4_9PROT|nr:glycerol dehydrogenase [Acidisoma cellulosilyticum]MCB8882591.1 glycerol dehydrogenase [Acidisoma cellulosilyticum]